MDDVVYSRAGRGEPLVLIHGIGHRRQAWDAVLPLLTPYRDVIAIDLPGFGESPESKTGYGVESAVEMFEKFCAGLGLERPHVAGNSLGGLLSLAFGEAGLVRSVTALSPAGIWTRSGALWAFAMLAAHRRLAERMPEPVVRRVAATTAGRIALAGMIFAKPWLIPPDKLVSDALAFGAAPGFAPTLAKAREGFSFHGSVPDIPVTIAWGRHDRLLARPKAADLRKIAPQVELVTLPGCGHTPMSDAPELVARVLLEGSANNG
ncbi:alpha/beta fold hydrolase [Amycolatopsis sp. NPDC059027]|uniref:alpha/beta fold hydrolase n=1 Tax=Amycolatopsis sp. NPDC059027 TaxID=3346709 RepID=UPI00366DCAFB